MIIVQGIFIPFFAAAKPQVTAEIKQVVLREIGAKWGKFSEQDLSALKGNDDLVTQVVAKYGVEKAPRAASEFIDRQRRWKETKMAACDSVDAAEPFDYQAVAELFPARNRKLNRQFTGYRRFDSAADALRFAMEELPPKSLLGAYLEVEEKRFDSNAMRRLYDSAEFPLVRRAAA